MLGRLFLQIARQERGIDHLAEIDIAIEHADIFHGAHSGLEKRHLNPAFAIKLRFDQLLHHRADVFRRQRRIDRFQDFAGVSGVLVDELHRLAPAGEDGAELVGILFHQVASGDADCRRQRRQVPDP